MITDDDIERLILLPDGFTARDLAIEVKASRKIRRWLIGVIAEYGDHRTDRSGAFAEVVEMMTERP